MTVDPSLEAPRPADGAGFSDALTFSFADPRAGIFGLARAGLAGGRGSGLAVLFRDQDTVAASAEGDTELSADGWHGIDAGGVRTEVLEPLRRWRARYDGDGGGFDLEFEALGDAAQLTGGGMTGYEHACRVQGSATVAGTTIAVDGLGQRGHGWGSPDWSRLGLVRTIGAWFGDDLAVMIQGTRAAKARDHEHEELSAVVLEGRPLRPGMIEEPRLSTTYDDGDRARHAGFELWPPEESEAFVRRGAGEVICGTTLDLGRLRLDTAFLVWRMEGRQGIGRYDVLRRA